MSKYKEIIGGTEQEFENYRKNHPYLKNHSFEGATIDMNNGKIYYDHDNIICRCNANGKRCDCNNTLDIDK